ncbi:methionyl-tRNA formyltransferase [bacterium]|nr:methionyl-tRNA formyltransferase [bacterium]
MTIRVLYYGTPDFAVPPLRALLTTPPEHTDPVFEVAGVVTQPDRPSGRGKKLSPSPVKQLAEEHQIPVLQPENIRSCWDEWQEELSRVLGETPDVAVVCAFGQILPLPCLHYPRSGSVNIHASLLPRWRGAAPIQRAIMANDTESGISLMQMEEGLDTGPYFAQARIPITETTTGGELHDALAALGGEMLVQYLPMIVSGRCTATTQDECGVTYAKKIHKDECLIDWHKPAKEVAAHIRALAPFPGAYTFFRGKRLKLLNARSLPPLEGEAGETFSPGEISRAENGTLEVQCSDQTVGISELQLEGKAKLSTSEFLKGQEIASRERLLLPSQKNSVKT